VAALLDEETYWLRSARASTPVLQVLANYRVPAAGDRR
jgi:hypothetical protein